MSSLDYDDLDDWLESEPAGVEMADFQWEIARTQKLRADLDALARRKGKPPTAYDGVYRDKKWKSDYRLGLLLKTWNPAETGRFIQ